MERFEARKGREMTAEVVISKVASMESQKTRALYFV